MQRWDIDFSGSPVEKDDGDYVLYSDASSALTASEARVRTLEALLNETSAQLGWIATLPPATGNHVLQKEYKEKCTEVFLKSRSALGDVTATKGEAK